MVEPLADRVIRRIGQAAELYYRLVMLVAPAGAGKTATLQDVHERTTAVSSPEVDQSRLKLL